MTSNKDKVFIIGLVFLLLGWTACLNIYFIIFAGPLFVVGLIILWSSKKKLVTKLLWTVLPLVLWYPGRIAFLLIATKRMTPKTFLIPEHFRGEITLIYNENCGQELRNETGRLIYKIPDNGIMILKNELETGIIDHEYYLVDDQGNKNPQDRFTDSTRLQ